MYTRGHKIVQSVTKKWLLWKKMTEAISFHKSPTDLVEN